MDRRTDTDNSKSLTAWGNNKSYITELHQTRYIKTIYYILQTPTLSSHNVTEIDWKLIYTSLLEESDEEQNMEIQ